VANWEAAMRTIVAGILLFPALAWNCTCFPPDALCKGVPIEDGPGIKIFVGRVVSTFPTSQRQAWDLEEKYMERHREDKGSFEGRKRFLLELWGDSLSAESRESIRAAVDDKKIFGILNYPGVALSRLEVVEPFPGTKVGEIVDMFGGLGGGDCSFHFEPGASYLVFARRGEGFWSTSICTRTRKLDGLNRDLETLRARRDGRPEPGSIYGRLADKTQRGDWSGPNTVGGFPVRLSGPDVTRIQQTDRYGFFTLDDLYPGTYRFEAAKPGWSMRTGHKPVQLNGGCVEITANVVEEQSSLSGRARAPAGETLTPTPVTLEGAV
jgi:hypothetical protein